MTYYMTEVTSKNSRKRRPDHEIDTKTLSQAKREATKLQYFYHTVLNLWFDKEMTEIAAQKIGKEWVL